MKKLICKILGHRMKPHRAYSGSSYCIEKCDRCGEKGKTLEATDNKEALRTTPWIPKKK